MHQPYHEEVAWQRLQDLQREMENSRRMTVSLQRTLVAAWLLAQRAWVLAGLATRRPPRRRPVAADHESEVAA